MRKRAKRFFEAFNLQRHINAIPPLRTVKVRYPSGAVYTYRIRWNWQLPKRAQRGQIGIEANRCYAKPRGY